MNERCRCGSRRLAKSNSGLCRKCWIIEHDPALRERYTCEDCGKKLYRKAKSRRCVSCGARAKNGQGEKANNWRGGRRLGTNGYIYEWVPEDHHFAKEMRDCRGTILEHRLVMAEKLGRPLKHNEHVHHRNGNKTDNHLDNLELIAPQHHRLTTSLEIRLRQLEQLLMKYRIEIPPWPRKSAPKI